MFFHNRSLTPSLCLPEKSSPGPPEPPTKEMKDLTLEEKLRKQKTHNANRPRVTWGDIEGLVDQATRLAPLPGGNLIPGPMMVVLLCVALTANSEASRWINWALVTKPPLLAVANWEGALPKLFSNNFNLTLSILSYPSRR